MDIWEIFLRKRPRPTDPIEDHRWPRAGKSHPAPDPRCVCGKPLLLYVPPGEVAHPCSVHPEYAIFGSEVTC